MKRICIFLVALIASGAIFAQADEIYTRAMLKGMKTAIIFYIEIDTPKCPFERGIEKKAASALGKLKTYG